MRSINHQWKPITRLLNVCFLGTLTILIQFSVIAQQREPIRTPVEANERQPVKLDEDGVLRLQATIRGDQQQPRILSIVPWESPAHRRISRVALTGETSDSMASLHRHTFLQRIALYDQLKSAIPNAKETQ